MELIVALIVAVPVALVVTGIAMHRAARANRMAERWDHYCNHKGG